MKNKRRNEQGICPVCGNEYLDYGSIELDGSALGYPWHCDSCDSTGTEWYELTFIGHADIEEWTAGEEGAEFEQEEN